MSTGIDVRNSGRDRERFAAPRPRGDLFRFPTVEDPGPTQGRLLAMAFCACFITLCGLAVTALGLLAIAGGATPGWYEPTMAATALVGVALVAGAFLSIHRPLLPWLLLVAALGPLAVNVATTVQVL